MPKEAIHIRDFRGIVGSVDAHDAPLGSAVYAENLDTVLQQGLFTPLPLDTVIGATTYGKCDGVALYDSGDVGVLVDRSASDTAPTIRVVTTSSMANITSAATAASGRLDRDTMASDGESVHVGLGASSTAKPKWVGEIFHGQFGGAAPGTSIVDAEIKAASCVGIYTVDSNTRFRLPEYTLAGTLRTWDISQTNFRIGTTYLYLASLVYDGHQEGPLEMIAFLTLSRKQVKLQGLAPTGATSTSTVDTDSGVLIDYDNSTYDFTWLSAVAETTPNDVPCDGLNRVSFEIRIRNSTGGSFETLPTRVTAINIYRSAIAGSFTSSDIWNLTTGSASFPEPEFLQHIKIQALLPWVDEDLGSSADHFDLTTETYHSYAFVDELPGGLSTFESRTGYPATLEHMKIHYGVSCVAESYHIIGRAWHQDLLDIGAWLFRSKPYRYDTFDWSQEYLVLPSEPNALVYWAGKVYAFGDARTHVVNPATFDLEDTWEGIGAPARRSIIVTDRGMFWADNNNIYFHDGSNVQPIGAPVLRNQKSTEAAWLSRDTAYHPVVVYDSRYDSIMVCYTTLAGSAAALMYSVTNQTWSFVTFAGVAGPFYTGFQASDGRAYVSLDATAAPKFYSLFTNATNRAWKWISPIIESVAEKAKYFKARVSYKTNRPTVKFYDNDPTYATAHTITDWTVRGGQTEDGELTTSSDAFLTFRQFALELEGTATQDATHIALIVRRITAR